MKKMFTMIALLSVFTLSSSSAWAQWGGPMMQRGWGSYYMNNPYYNSASYYSMPMYNGYRGYMPMYGGYMGWGCW